MSSIVLELNTCTGKIVRVDICGMHYDLHFVTNNPTDEEVTEAVYNLEQRLFDQIVSAKIIESEELD